MATYHVGGATEVGRMTGAAARLRRAAEQAAEAGDELARRAGFLDDPERMIYLLSLRRHVSLREIARLGGVNPGTVCRRLRSIRRRLEDPIVAALLTPRRPGVAAAPFGEGDRRMAVAHFLNRRAVADLAAEHGLTPPVVRKRLTWVKGWCQGRRDAASDFRRAAAARAAAEAVDRQ